MGGVTKTLRSMRLSHRDFYPLMRDPDSTRVREGCCERTLLTVRGGVRRTARTGRYA
jgi:hypothetical protein